MVGSNEPDKDRDSISSGLREKEITFKASYLGF